MRKMREEGAGGGSWCPACLRCPSRRSPFPVVCGYLRPPCFRPVVPRSAAPLSTPRAVARGSGGVVLLALVVVIVLPLVVLSRWWSLSYRRCCYGGGVCCPACPSSVVVVWWSCRPPLRSSPFCPTSVAHGRGGWCCVTRARSRSRPSPYWPDCSRRLVVRVVMVAVVVLVLVVVIVLRCLVSSNKMRRERKKTYVRPKRRR
jgi:hypothetical protein